MLCSSGTFYSGLPKKTLELLRTRFASCLSWMLIGYLTNDLWCWVFTACNCAAWLTGMRNPPANQDNFLRIGCIGGECLCGAKWPIGVVEHFGCVSACLIFEERQIAVKHVFLQRCLLVFVLLLNGYLCVIVNVCVIACVSKFPCNKKTVQSDRFWIDLKYSYQ